jgi:hemerythrin-like domain-containing protein
MGSYEFINPVVHAAVRRDVTRLTQVVQQPMNRRQRAALARRVAWMVDGLHVHHEGEDHAIWPRAVSKRPELAGLLAEMEAEHERLSTAADAMVASAAAYATDGSEPARAGLAEAVERFADVALAHLQHEETATVPLLLDLFDEDEWAQIDKEFKTGVTPRQLGWLAMWLLDDLPGDQARLLRHQVPAPVFAYLTWRYGRAYDRDAAHAWGQLARTRGG